MKRSVPNFNSGNLRASSSNVDNFRNQGLKKISNNMIPDNYNYRNHNYVNVKYENIAITIKIVTILFQNIIKV